LDPDLRQLFVRQSAIKGSITHFGEDGRTMVG